MHERLKQFVAIRHLFMFQALSSYLIFPLKESGKEERLSL